MTVLDEILAWSNTPTAPWVKDALRRIVTQPALTEKDLQELAELCKKPHGLTTTDLTPQPLATEHLPAGTDQGAVSLSSLTHVADVNALAPNERITFRTTGLTAIYGDNGAGKSGYARILKRACRSRGSGEPVLANALSEKPAGTPTAKLSLSSNGVVTEHTWKDGSPAPAELSAISVFDSAAAQVYVADKTEVRFRPFGLDVLDKLAAACAQVKARLEGERNLLSQAPVWPPLPKETEAARLISSLTALTPRDQVDRVATLSESERKELQMLDATLAVARAEDPAKRASDLKMRASRIRQLVGDLKQVASNLGTENISRLLSMREAAVEAVGLAAEAARLVSRESVVPGFGTGEWRALWNAAQRYSEAAAYPGMLFPHTGEGSVCVLCQHQLDEAAKSRLKRFGEFIRGEAQADALRKQKIADDVLAACLAAPVERVSAAVDDLATLDESCFDQVKALILEAGVVRNRLRELPSETKPLSAVPPIARLEELVSELESRSRELTKAADPDGRRRAEGRHDELRARGVLAEIREQLHAEVGRRARLNAYELCIRDTDTRGISKLSTDLTKKYVTNALTVGFTEQLKSLGFQSLELELRAVGASKGVLYHQVFLKQATKAQLPKVVSEGEAR